MPKTVYFSEIVNTPRLSMGFPDQRSHSRRIMVGAMARYRQLPVTLSETLRTLLADLDRVPGVNTGGDDRVDPFGR